MHKKVILRHNITLKSLIVLQISTCHFLSEQGLQSSVNYLPGQHRKDAKNLDMLLLYTKPELHIYLVPLVQCLIFVGHVTWGQICTAMHAQDLFQENHLREDDDGTRKSEDMVGAQDTFGGSLNLSLLWVLEEPCSAVNFPCSFCLTEIPLTWIAQ